MYITTIRLYVGVTGTLSIVQFTLLSYLILFILISGRLDHQDHNVRQDGLYSLTYSPTNPVK